MNISAPFIRRPIATTLLAVGLAVAGFIAFLLLPVAPLPQVEFPTIIVQGSLPGASPEIMATSVATPLERQLGRIAGVTEMTSSSSLGSSRIILQFDLSRDINGAASDVQAAINAAKSNLPANLPSNPIYRKINPADAPVLILALTSDTYKPGEMYDVAYNILAQRLAQVDGVGEALVGGSSLPAVRVELNPFLLNQYGISLGEVSSALSSANANLAKGQIKIGDSTSELYTSDELFKAYQYAPLIIAYKNDRPVRISDVGQVVDSNEDLRNAGSLNGKPAVFVIIFKQPGANVITMINNVKGIMPQLQGVIPAAMKMSVVMDRTTTIRASLHDVELTLVIAMLLVILVVYLFLGNFRSMIIPGVAVPLSLLGTFGMMRLLGYSLDNLSLMALTISTGFVVDDAVVVVENITRYIEMGKPALESALIGAKEVSFTVLSMSLSLIAVFTPIILMGGIVGRLFREFAITLSTAILVSMVISLTVTPMMCAWLLKPHSKKEEKPSRYQQFFINVKHKYSTSLKWALAHPNLMLFIFFATFALNILLFVVVPKGFFPQQDTGRISGSIQGEQDISFQAMRTILTQFIDVVRKDPAVENTAGFVGSGSTNTGSIFISLKPESDRNVTSDQVINRLRGKLDKITGAKLFMQSAQDLNIGGRQGNAQFQYSLSSDNLTDLNHWAPIIMERLKKLPGIADVNSDQRSHGLQIMVNVDHDRAMRFGITPQLIDSTLYSAFGQAQVSTMYTTMNQYHVVMELAPEFWQYPQTLNNIFIKLPQANTTTVATLSSNASASLNALPAASITAAAKAAAATTAANTPAANMVPLSEIAKFEPTNTLLSVNHQGLAPSATLSFNLLPNVSLGDAVSAVGKTVDGMHLPATVRGSFRGAAQAFQDSLSSEPYLILLALVAVYIVLGMLYESLIHPITILSTLPSAGVGALLALIITGVDLSIISLIGIILLIGIVKKNAIMMIDFALELERNEGKAPADAIYEAALLRFRPIMMTTLAALLGALPLAVGLGNGSELRRPLGIAIIGGLLVSQALTLYTTPIIYLSFERMSRWSKENLHLFRPRRIRAKGAR